MKKFALVMVCLFLYNNTFCQANKNSSPDNPYFQLQSIHVDVTSLIYIIDLSISSDFEIYKTKLQDFGIQSGYSFFAAGSVGGSQNGSPFHDINFLAYSSIGYDKPITTQLIFGFTYRTSSKANTERYPLGGLKYGISFNLNFSKFFRIYIKYSALSNSANFGMSAVGLGLSIGWTR